MNLKPQETVYQFIQLSESQEATEIILTVSDSNKLKIILQKVFI